ncbi:hypothetical protein PC116_g30225 [Phytophthora cactorum]|uniref:Uncharacterized protein n=1 Tax=Phytophthora cactorum TaxID=29920 RepID=A0A8T1AD02_9STRA|nr:hypothetical protein PC114_g27462 [Phytophthora cactorum]KAG2875812.1 hypothetical protein PC117_g27364 [Phytophthora cactorum]KAG2957616.1 hypothetical protein PC119_g27275 [Phytophthora cactorum]KAG3122017.1 hypothetical protein C6341_g27149 [Phytophthora cactorum]KAG4221300.1 hypothetical protein PC116_g30225 [Phytophthora cactorum]
MTHKDQSVLRSRKQHVDSVRCLQKSNRSTAVNVRAATNQTRQYDGGFFSLEIVNGSSSNGTG